MCPPLPQAPVVDSVAVNVVTSVREVLQGTPARCTLWPAYTDPESDDDDIAEPLPGKMDVKVPEPGGTRLDNPEVKPNKTLLELSGVPGLRVLPVIKVTRASEGGSLCLRVKGLPSWVRIEGGEEAAIERAWVPDLSAMAFHVRVSRTVGAAPGAHLGYCLIEHWDTFPSAPLGASRN